MSSSAALIVSVSGIRGIVGDSLTPEVALRFAAAYGAWLRGGRVLVSRDGRPSGEMLRHAVLAGLLASGCAVEDIGIAPTPTCGFLVRHSQAQGGIQITASHNPAAWNGLKMFGPDGAVLSAQDSASVQDLFQRGAHRWVAWDAVGKVRAHTQWREAHLEAVLRCIDVEAVRQARFRVFVDANGGAGGPLATELLMELGCEVTGYACSADGHFLHEAEPIPAHLTEVAPLVPRARAVVGFVLDPDADRLALIDETGRCLSEELTLALVVRDRLMQQPGPVVINMSTSRVIEDLATQAGCACVRAAVGEANVVAAMRQHQAVIGGEGNGGVIDPRIGWVRDPFIGMALILNLLAKTQQPLSQLVASLPSYAMRKTKRPVDRGQLAEWFAVVRQRCPEADLDDRDGLRLAWPDRWLHLRASNTEPIVRIIAEAPTEAEVEALLALVP